MCRRPRRRLQTEVELNLAAMLDMAFQLLAFFILTFRPSPIEGQLQLRLPPPAPTTNVQAGPPDAAQRPELQAAFEKSLDIRLLADAKGRLSSVQVGLAKVFDGPANAENLARLDQRLHDIFAVPQAEADQVMIRVRPELQYEELMKVIDVCTRQKLADGKSLHTINFTELTETEGTK